VVVAVSGGLVAGLGLPAQAAVSTSGDGALTASVPLLASAVPAASSTSAGADVLASAPLSAPAKARVDFEHSAFTAVSRTAHARPVAPATRGRDVAAVSRSLARAAYRAAQPVAPAPRVQSDADGDHEAGPKAAPEQAPVDGTTSAVVSIAMRYLGIAYRYGGTSPRGFDCSGFTQYVFEQVGVSLPRTADQQLRATTRIPRSEARPGDLVFYLGGGGPATHVGIYLGGGKMIDSPRTGKVVSVRAIYSSNVVFTRV
jgi:cell wall-associated NlpC family hydrolase